MDSIPLTDAEATALRDWMNSDVARKSRRHASQIMDSTRSWVDPGGYRLSDRIWNTRTLARHAIDRRLREAIAAGEDALKVADEFERWLQPGLRPARNANGFIIMDSRPGLAGSPVLSFGPRGQYPGSYSTRRLMRTEISRIGGQETDEIAIELGLLVEWLLSNRHPKRDNCDNNAEGSSPGQPPGIYTVEQCPRHPDHPHCFPAGVMVDGPEIEKSYTRWYSGDLVNIRTALGHDLAVTPNHPILTPHGWIPAGKLSVGNDVVSDRGVEWRPGGNPDDNNTPSLIEEVAITLGGASFVTTVSVPTSSEDFHGDGIDSEVCIVRTDGNLERGANASSLEPFAKKLFRRRDMKLSLLASERAPAFGVEGFRRLTSRLLGFGNHGSTGFGSHVPMSDLDRLGEGSNLNALSEKAELDDVPGDTISLSECLLGHAISVETGDLLLGKSDLRFDPSSPRHSIDLPAPASLDSPVGEDLIQEAGGHASTSSRGSNGGSVDVMLDRVVEINVRPFSGHVYNLQTRGNWYIANGIIVHNCLCTKTTYDPRSDEEVIADIRREFNLDHWIDDSGTMHVNPDVL